jgi:fatty acid desaturase
MSELTASQDRLLGLLEKYGRNLHSFMVLEPGLSVWFGEEAAIAYADRGGYWVAAGGPLCAPERALEVAKEFRSSAAKEGRKVVFFGVTQPLVDRLEGEFDSLAVGLAAVWNPTQWAEVVGNAPKLRNRLSKARRTGISARMIASDEVTEGAPLRRRFTEIVDSWTNQKALPPMGFMVTLELFQHRHRRRYFLVESGGVVHGFAVCVPIYGRNGWLLEDMMLESDAPPGCSEALVDAAMRRLCDERAEIVSLGMVALAGLDAEATPGNHPLLTGFLRFCSRTMGWLYNFDGLYRFRSKMKPTAWERVHVASGGKVDFWTIRAILMAFAEGWIPRFAVRMFGRWAQQAISPPLSTPAGAPPQKPLVDVPILMLAITCCVGMVAAVVGACQGWMPWWASLVIGFVAAYAGFTPVHEAVHGNVSQWRLVNAAVGHACALLLTGAFLPYCFLHREHHRHTNSPTDDPDFWCGKGPAWALPLRWLTQDVGYLQYYFGRWSTRPRTERTDLLLCSALYLGVAAGALLLNPPLFLALLLGWFVPARLALFALAATFSWLPHSPHQSMDPHTATTVRSSPWLTWALLGQNFHLVHHLDPGRPFYRLAGIWKRKRGEFVERGAVDRSDRMV